MYMYLHHTMLHIANKSLKLCPLTAWLFFTHTATLFWYATLHIVLMHVRTQYHACRPFDIISYALDKHFKEKKLKFDL